MTGEQHASPNPVLKHIRAISFDLDDTLWDCAPAILNAEETLYTWLERYHPQVVADQNRESMRELRANMYQTHPHLVTDVSMMRKASLQLLFDQHENSEQLVEQAFSVFYKARSEVVLYEGTHEILGALRERYKVAAITNGNASLQQIGISEYFHDIQSASLANPPKPEPDMFAACCRNLGIDAHELLHVGDNPQTDVVGGHNAGARTVWFNQFDTNWPEELRRADFEVKSLSELQLLLTRVASV